MIGKTLAHYEITEKIGAGGMGEVYRASDSKLGREVALKILPPAFSEDAERMARFEREAQALATLNHPGIVTIHSLEEAEGRRFLVMELIEGETLDSLVPEHGLDVKRALELAVSMADALSAAHEKGIVHRDLKPSNVMVLRDGRLKVLDFGLAKSANREPDLDRTRTLTDPVSALGSVVGTAPYMSPEQIRGEPVDARADVFAFGILLYEILTGRRPFRGPTTADVTSSILRDDPPPLRTVREEIPPDLERLVNHCLEKDRARRFQTSKDLRKELDLVREATTGKEPGSFTPAGPTGASSPTPEPAPSSTPPSSGVRSSIAVLPFLAGNANDEFFCDGMTEDLITEVSKIQSLRVFPRSTVAPFAGSDWTSADIARRIGASHLVEGSMRRAGDRLRVTARLVEAATGHAVWSDRFDRDMEDVFDIQDDIARSVARALRITLTDSEERQLEKVGTRNLSAYEYYLRGAAEFRHTGIIGSPEVVEFGVQMFRKAIEVDPQYARAWAAIAKHRAMHVRWLGGGPAEREEARKASEEALRIDPDSAEALVARANVLDVDGQREEARRHYARAVELQPRLWEAHYLRGRMEFAAGNTEAAIASFRKGQDADPQDVQCPKLIVMALESLGRSEEIAEAAGTALERIRHRLELEPDLPFLLDARAQVLTSVGRTEEALAFAEQIVARADVPESYLYNAACLFAKSGRPDRAKAVLVPLLKRGFGDPEWIRKDPDLATVIDDPQVQAALG